MKSKRDRLPYTASRGPLFRLGSLASGDLFGGSAATAGGSDGDEPFQPALRRRTLVFLLMTKWCGSSFCSVAAMRYSSSGRRPGAVTVQDTSLPSALSRESSGPTSFTPTPSLAASALMRHAVGLDVMNSSTLSRKGRVVTAQFPGNALEVRTAHTTLNRRRAYFSCPASQRTRGPERDKP